MRTGRKFVKKERNDLDKRCLRNYRPNTYYHLLLWELFTGLMTNKLSNFLKTNGDVNEIRQVADPFNIDIMISSSYKKA